MKKQFPKYSLIDDSFDPTNFDAVSQNSKMITIIVVVKIPLDKINRSKIAAPQEGKHFYYAIIGLILNNLLLCM